MQLDEFEKLSFGEKEEKRNEMFLGFRAGNLNNDDLELFIDQFTKGQIVLDKDNDDFEKMAAVLGNVEKENVSQINNWKLRHGRLNRNIKSSRNFKEWGLKRRANKLLAKTEKNHLKNLKLEEKFYGLSPELEKFYKDKSAYWVNQVINNRFIPAGISRALSKYYDNKTKDPNKKLKTKISLREEKIKNLENQVAGSGIFSNWGNKIKLAYNRRLQNSDQKKLIGNMRINELNEQRQLLEDKIKQTKESLSNSGTKALKKNLTKSLRNLEKLVDRIDARSVKLEHNYRIKKETSDKKFEQTAQLLQKQIKERCEFIDVKNQLLDRSTFRGKAMEKLLKGIPEGRKKSLEEIANGKKQETITEDSEFIKYLESKGFNKKQIDIIRGEANTKAHEAKKTSNYNDKKDANESEETETNKGTVNDGESNTPPANNNNWHQESEANLDEAFSNGYEKTQPQREGNNCDNENVLYASYKNKEDDHSITVEKANVNTYDVMAKDKNGNDQNPSVEDMKAVLNSLKKDGHDKMELGNIYSPEFYANTVIAAKECGLEITNAKETAEQMKKQFGENWKENLPQETKEAFEKATAPIINDAQKNPNQEQKEQEKSAENTEKQNEGETKPQEKLETPTHNGQQNKAANESKSQETNEQNKETTTPNTNGEKNKAENETKPLETKEQDKQETPATNKNNPKQEERISSLLEKTELSKTNDDDFNKFKQSEEYKKLPRKEKGLIKEIRKYNKAIDKLKEKEADNKDIAKARAKKIKAISLLKETHGKNSSKTKTGKTNSNFKTIPMGRGGAEI